MAELYGVRVYYGTGFNVTNRPADISVLNTAYYRDFPSNYLFQNMDLATTRVQAQWSEIADADYVRIGSTYYLVNSVSMLSPATAELNLVEDPLLTIGGVSAMRGVNGWVDRAHVSSSNDGLFSNILSEPWAPAHTLELDALEDLGLLTTGDRVNILQSTVKLDQIDHVAQEYAVASTQAGGATVVVPMIPEATDRCTFGITGAFNVSYVYPYSSYYFADNASVQEGSQDVRSLGIDSAILAAYQVPKVFSLAMSNPSSAVIRTLTSVTSQRIPSNNMAYRYGAYSPRNNKVYAMYNTYHVMSSCSGDSIEWSAHDIYSAGTDKPIFVEYADLSPTGKPYIQPVYYHGAQTKIFQEAVHGAQWLRLPIAYAQRSGALIERGNYVRSLERQEFDLIQSGVETAIDSAKSALSMDVAGSLEKSLKGTAGILRKSLDVKNDAVNYQTSQRIVAPEVRFAQDPEAQGYVGNTFWIYRTRLSDSDMERFDNFLTQFGYAQDKKFELSDLTNRTYFNFIKTRDAEILGVNAPLRVRQNCASLFNSGVRLWHVLPNTAAMTYNP